MNLNFREDGLECRVQIPGKIILILTFFTFREILGIHGILLEVVRAMEVVHRVFIILPMESMEMDNIEGIDT